MQSKRTIGIHLLPCLALACFAALQPQDLTQAPTLTSVAPDNGITTPGTNVEVRGAGLRGDAVIYFGGVGARQTTVLSPSQLEVVTPYLRPGSYQLELKIGDAVVRSRVSFTALPAEVDAKIDMALGLAGNGKNTSAIELLTEIYKTNEDYQVRAFAAYQIGQVYYAEGDLWRWAGAPIFLDSDKSGLAVDTNWRYRSSLDRSTYYLPTGANSSDILRMLDWTVQKDVTQNPEPRFFRGLVNARFGDFAKAEADSQFILKAAPENASYQALSAYVAALKGQKPDLTSLDPERISDGRALSLFGEAAYLEGDSDRAQQFWLRAARVYPLGATLAFWAGKRHLKWGQIPVGVSLLRECIAMAPTSKEAKQAAELLR